MDMEGDASAPSRRPGETKVLGFSLAQSQERAQARRAETILEQITTSAKDFAIILLTPDGRVELWNKGAERLLGYDERQIHGQLARILFTPEDQAKNDPEEELEQARVSGRAESDRWLQRQDGSRFWASGVTSAVYGLEGKLEGFVKILRDQTARKVLEEDLVRVNETLENRIRERTADLEDALKEMAAFSYSIAHDLRAPLRAMTGFAQALSEDFGQALGEAGQECAARISEAALHMDRMIHDLLTYSQMTRSEIQCHPLNPGEVLDEVIQTLEAEIREKGAQVTVEGPLPPVLSHEITLEQVFRNLLSNALKFVAPGVRPRIRIWGEERPEWIRITVEDNGIGIPEEYRKKIFGIFERLHPQSDYPGTGIGLAIVHRAVERMRGRVGVDPGENDQGSRFWVEFRKVASA